MRHISRTAAADWGCEGTSMQWRRQRDVQQAHPSVTAKLLLVVPSGVVSSASFSLRSPETLLCTVSRHSVIIATLFILLQ